MVQHIQGSTSKNAPVKNQDQTLSRSKCFP
eukprot:UN16636